MNWQLQPIRSLTPFTPSTTYTYLNAPLFPHRQYLSKADLQVLDHVNDYLSGKKKKELTDWWLQYIEDSVEKYLQQQGYDPTCVPYQYLDKPPSSMARLQENIRIVHRLLGDMGHKVHPHSSKTMSGLINPVKERVYAEVDTLCKNFKLVLWDQINGYGCRMDFSHISSLRNNVFLEEAIQHLNTIRGHISRTDAAGMLISSSLYAFGGQTFGNTHILQTKGVNNTPYFISFLSISCPFFTNHILSSSLPRRFIRIYIMHLCGGIITLLLYYTFFFFLSNSILIYLGIFS